jgi:hypothetical protein
VAVGGHELPGIAFKGAEALEQATINARAQGGTRTMASCATGWPLTPCNIG